MKSFPNQRKEQQKTIQELFKTKNIKKLHRKEQRKEELEKLNEVQTQDKTYYYTLFSCLFVIFVLIGLALFGGYQ